MAVFAVVVSALVLIRPLFAVCTVRMHYSGNCVNDGSDVINTYTTGKYKWEGGETVKKWTNGWGYYNDHDDQSWGSMATKLEGETSAISFEGNCWHVEVYDQGTDQGYGDNCIVEDGEIKTGTKCYWSCNTKANCGGAHVKNCVAMRYDLNDDVGGLYIKEGRSVNREVNPSFYMSAHSHFVVMGASASMIAVAVAGVAICYKRGKTEFEEPMII